MDDLVKRLAALRKEHAAMVEELRAREAELAPWREAVSQKAAEVAEIEVAIRLAAQEAYVNTGDKHPHPAVGIRVQHVLHYDADKALEWARQHYPEALKLDVSKFEKVARAMELDWVQDEEVPQATIARDLSAFIG